MLIHKKNYFLYNTHMLKALIVEIKNVIFKSWYHAIRFGGLLLIPLVYGFSYIFAFYDPFTNTDKLPIAIVTQVSAKSQPATISSEFQKALSKSFGETTELETGDLKMKIKMNSVEVSDTLTPEQLKNKIDEIDRSHFATIVIPKLNHNAELTNVIQTFIGTKTLLEKIAAVKALADAIKGNAKNPGSKILINNNFKKNYLISFGIDVGSSMFGGSKFVVDKLIHALKDQQFIEHVKKTLLVNPTLVNKYKEVIEKIEKSNILTFSPIALHSHMGEKAKYGYGLAPFFISVAMWIGGMVMTFAVHKKIYDKTILPGLRYLAKWLLISFGTIVQASVLIGALYLIGFDKLGLTHILSLFGFAIFTGIVFSANIQAIRFIIPNRNVGIFVIIILLVLQMASGGGLFPIETQSGFYKTIHNLLPMGHSIALFRELSFNTDWSVVFNQIGYLSIYLLIVPFAVVGYHYQNLKKYEQRGWELPVGFHRRYKVRKGDKNV